MTSSQGHWDALGQLVRKRRRELGIPTQHAAAELGNISKNTWQRLENGQPVGDSSLVSVAGVLRWPFGYIHAVLSDGKDAPMPVSGTLASTLPSLQAHMEAEVGEPEVRYVVVEESATATDSAVVEGAPGETVVARPDVVTGKASVPGPAVSSNARPVTATASVVVVGTGQTQKRNDDWSYLSISVPIERDSYAELDQREIAYITSAVTTQARAIVRMIAEARRDERSKRGFESASEWPPMNVADDGS